MIDTQVACHQPLPGTTYFKSVLKTGTATAIDLDSQVPLVAICIQPVNSTRTAWCDEDTFFVQCICGLLELSVGRRR